MLTNHALHAYPSIDTFPQVEASNEHSSFLRYRKLSEAIAAHQGQWSPEQINALLDQVHRAYVDGRTAGIADGVPERTLWNYLADPADRSYHFRFQQHDLGPEPGTNHMRVQRTAPIEVRMDKILI